MKWHTELSVLIWADAAHLYQKSIKYMCCAEIKDKANYSETAVGANSAHSS